MPENQNQTGENAMGGPDQEAVLAEHARQAQALAQAVAQNDPVRLRALLSECDLFSPERLRQTPTLGERALFQESPLLKNLEDGLRTIFYEAITKGPACLPVLLETYRPLPYMIFYHTFRDGDHFGHLESLRMLVEEARRQPELLPEPSRLTPKTPEELRQELPMAYFFRDSKFAERTDWMDLLTEFVPLEDAQEVLAEHGAEKLPRTAAMIEAIELAAVVQNTRTALLGANQTATLASGAAASNIDPTGQEAPPPPFKIRSL